MHQVHAHLVGQRVVVDVAGLDDGARHVHRAQAAVAASVASAHADRFAWVASIHPYREDALTRLEAAIRSGAVALKWLPSSMNIDLRDARLRPFYDRLAATRAGVCLTARRFPGRVPAGTVALVVPDITNPFFTTIARGVEDFFVAHGFSVMYCGAPLTIATR